jgi:hypothetical protein
MHSQRFLAYHPEGRFQRDDKIVFWKGKPVAVLPLAREEVDGVTWGKSPYGASFGGMVVLPMSSLKAEKVAEAMAETLVNEGYDKLFLAMAPSCYEISGCSVNYFLLKNARSWTHDRGLCTVVPLGVRKSSESYRRNCRKAKSSGLVVKEGCDIDALYPILEATLLPKANGFITHTREELHRLSDLLGERMRTFLAYRNGTAIAGVLVFKERTGVHCFYNGHLKETAELCPLHSVFEAVIDRYCGQFAWLDLGLSDRVYVSTNHGLLQFKEGMGGVPMYRDYYELTLDGEENG